MVEKKQKLVLGSAGKKHPDAVTLDIDAAHAPDVVWDLARLPWPFADDQFGEIVCHHVLEHLDDIDGPMRELHRICRPDGSIYVEVPHFSSWCAQSPFHKLRFGCFAFDGYLAGVHTWQTGPRFRMLKRQLTFHRSFRRVFLHTVFNRFPLSYERFWTYIFPAEHVKFWLQPIKGSRP